MTNAQITAALADSVKLEREAREHWQRADTSAERDAALDVVRHSTVVIRSLEKWIAARQLAAQT